LETDADSGGACSARARGLIPAASYSDTGTPKVFRITESAVKATLLQVHSIVGLVIALLLTAIALTGVTMSFEDEIQAGLNARISRVEARQAPQLTPDALITRLQADHHDGRVAAVTLSSDRTAAVRIRFAPGGGGSRPASVFVDPYDAHVLGTARGEEFFATVRRLHRWLLIPGDAKGYGRKVTGIAAVGLIVMLISGLVLRWPHRSTCHGRPGLMRGCSRTHRTVPAPPKPMSNPMMRGWTASRSHSTASGQRSSAPKAIVTGPY
jgi:uncharacterized iron-regulated membrane protein